MSNKKSVRIILSKKGREHAAPLFKELDILPLDELIKLKRGTFMWKLDNNLLPQSNSGWFSLSNSVIRKRLNLSKYRIPNPRIGYTKRHSIYSATKLWNTEIPIQLKQSTSLKVFKKSYKNNLKNLMMCISFLYYWILYSSLHLSRLKKTFTAYTVYLHFAAFWLVNHVMTVTTFSELRESSLASSVNTRHLQHLSNVY